jgi:hypothetical protein
VAVSEPSKTSRTQTRTRTFRETMTTSSTRVMKMIAGRITPKMMTQKWPKSMARVFSLMSVRKRKLRKKRRRVAKRELPLKRRRRPNELQGAL